MSLAGGQDGVGCIQRHSSACGGIKILAHWACPSSKKLSSRKVVGRKTLRDAHLTSGSHYIQSLRFLCCSSTAVTWHFQKAARTSWCCHPANNKKIDHTYLYRTYKQFCKSENNKMSLAERMDDYLLVHLVYIALYQEITGDSSLLWGTYSLRFDSSQDS